MELVASGFALLAGMLFGLAMHFQKRGLTYADGLTGSFISVLSMAVMFWLAAAVQIDQIELSWWATKATIIFAVCGLLWPAMGQRLQIASVANAGPTITSAIGSLSPVFAIIPAILLFDEDVDIQGLAGITLLMGGLFFASRVIGSGVRLSSFLVLLLPLGASFARGVVKPVAKLGMFEVPSPFFASLVMVSVSATLLGSIVLARRKVKDVFVFSKGRVWFVANGLLIGCGIFAVQSAVQAGDVMLTAPLISTTPLWALVFGVLLFRSETSQWRHAVMAALVFSGSVLIVTA